jgi:hypothetical protein
VLPSLALAVEDVAPDALAHGHAHVDIEANAGDADASILFVLGGEVCVVVVVVVTVAVARVRARLRVRGAHGEGNLVSYSGGCLRPMQGGWRRWERVFVRRGAEDAQLPGYRRE